MTDNVSFAHARMRHLQVYVSFRNNYFYYIHDFVGARMFILPSVRFIKE